MTEKKPHTERRQPQDATEVSNIKTIPAREVGVSLTVSEKAIKEADRIQEENFMAAQKVQKYSWR